MNKKLNIKNKFINHIMNKGRKMQSEKLLLKSIKELNKLSKKQIKNLMQLSIIQTSPTFKLHTSVNKKRKKKKFKTHETPAFITQSANRTSLAIKYVLSNSEKQFTHKFYDKFKREVIELMTQKDVHDNKIELQKKVISKKNYLRYYRWK